MKTLKDRLEEKLKNPNLLRIDGWQLINEDKETETYRVKYTEVIFGIKGRDIEEVTILKQGIN